MRRCALRVVLPLLLSGHPALAAAHPSEATNPEAVYYANAYADHYDLPRELIHAVITQESGWHSRALSDVGAMGLMQLMPGTARMLGVQNPVSIRDNISGGVRYLALLTRQFHGDYRMALAAYYCGSRHIVHSGLGYHNAEVVAYVESIHHIYQRELNLHHTASPKGDTP